MNNKPFRYATLMRPPQMGAVPVNGLISVCCEEGTAPSGHHYWGWAEYTHELTAEEVRDYELERIGNG